ncbi:MAG: T9SS type A sorting domain-containing protein [Bacteroidales bacterium]
MKHFLLCIFISLISLTAVSQRDTASTASSLNNIQRSRSGETVINIYPVPVRDGAFTITSDKEIISARITNVIGQDILRIQFSDPLQTQRVSIDNIKKGMYIVTVYYKDQTRSVKKILVEGSL